MTDASSPDIETAPPPPRPLDLSWTSKPVALFYFGRRAARPPALPLAGIRDDLAALEKASAKAKRSRAPNVKIDALMCQSGETVSLYRPMRGD